MSCVDKDGADVLCTNADTAADDASNNPACTSATIDTTIKSIITDMIEFGCQRYDKIEFSSPKETFVRCTPGLFI